MAETKKPHSESSKPEPVQPVFSRKATPLGKREQTLIFDLIGAIVDSNNTGTRYTDEQWKLKIGEFPKVVKYEREGEKKEYPDAEYFLHNGEIWIPKGMLKNPYLVLKTILLALTKLTEKKDLDAKEYLARLEKVLPELI